MVYSSLFGLIIILHSIHLIYKSRGNKWFLVLSSVISYINVSVAVLDCIMQGRMAKEYQNALRMSSSGLCYIKCYLIVVLVLDIILSSNTINKMPNAANEKERIIRYNPLIATGCALVSGILTVTQFGGSISDSYHSNQNALYEYVPMIMILGLHYSNNQKVYNQIYGVIGLFYIITSLAGGDRSSAFMMLLMLTIWFWGKLFSVGKMLLLSLAGIILSNIIAIIRTNSNMISDGLFNSLLSKGVLFFCSDTVSYSFYAGVTVVAYSNIYSGNMFDLTFRWVTSLVFGMTDSTNIIRMAQSYYPSGGGGMYPAYFYFMGGYVGVIVSSILLSLIIKKVFLYYNEYSQLFQIALITYTFRWYLYSPFTLYRTLLINFTILYVLCKISDCYLKKSG